MQDCPPRMKFHASVCVWCCLVMGAACLGGVRHVARLAPDAVSLGGKAVEGCKIFCNTKILHHVQTARVFNDSKIFMDLKLKESPEVIERRFNALLNMTNDSPKKEDVEKFIGENFDSSLSEFEVWTPSDWKRQPEFIHDIYDQSLRNWAKSVNEIWKSLGRKVSTDVRDNASRYSQIYVPHPFIVPGGRFSELYYWDSYWIVEGLLLSEMLDTARGMIENFLYLVKKYGYVPNGTRKYYLGRSQPPFLIPMMHLYWKRTGDIKFLRESISLLEKEYSFWEESRSVTVTLDGRAYKVFQYRVDTTYARPESYYEDEKLANGTSDQEKLRIYSGLKSAAESGWDFSSRWFLADGKRTSNLRDVNPMVIAPVCLNSFMGLNARILSEFHEILGNEVQRDVYREHAEESNTTMSRVFWSDRDGIWLDYNLERDELIPGFYPSNFIPLWTESYGKERSPEFVIEQAIAYLDRHNITAYPGGIPTSLMDTGQQWDLPLGWAPLQYMVVLGLQKAGKYNEEANNLALTFARQWVLNVYQTYLNTTPHKMLEKYTVTEVGNPEGQGGEYRTQEGFGWTNAVALKFLSMYGHQIRTRDVYDPVPLSLGLLLMVVCAVSVMSYVRRVHTCHKLWWDVENPS
ncbi:Trehalase [Chionoecetes opilio]|uniref:Trehalase n=1 Tax=Chionoecetes opilio TaxID=41210 RepID=A0A8J4YJ12_CHIOP|nr:Trehalase [Chionoecetes opilio]